MEFIKPDSRPAFNLIVAALIFMDDKNGPQIA